MAGLGQGEEQGLGDFEQQLAYAIQLSLQEMEGQGGSQAVRDGEEEVVYQRVSALPAHLPLQDGPAGGHSTVPGKENTSADEGNVQEADEFMDKVITLMKEHPVVPPSARPDYALFEKTHELRKQLMAGQIENEQQKAYAKQRSMMEIVGWVIECRLERILGKLNGDQANQLSELIVNGGLGGLGREKGTDPAKQLKVMLEELHPCHVKQIVNGLDATQLKQLLSGIDGNQLKNLFKGFGMQFLEPDQLKEMVSKFDGHQLKQMIASIDEVHFANVLQEIDVAQLRQLFTSLNADQLSQLVNAIAGEEKARDMMQAFGGLLQ